ncbi:13034_t:CDS:1, partial [Racocetra persica]
LRQYYSENSINHTQLSKTALQSVKTIWKAIDDDAPVPMT